MTTVRPVFSKILAVVLLVVPLALVWPVVVVPLLDLFASYDQGIAQSEALLARYGRVVKSKAALEKTLAQVRQSDVVKRGFFRERSAELAAASIQQLVQKSVTSSGARLASVQVLPVQTVGGFQQIGVRARMSGTIEGLRGTLYALETAWPLLFTDNVNVYVRRIRRIVGLHPAQEVGDLQIEFDVYGYFGKAVGQTATAGRK